MAKRWLHQSTSLEVWLDEENGWLYAEWRGQHNNGSLQDGINLLIALIKAHQISKVLNDTTRMSGVWVSTASWLVTKAFPRARLAGMRSFAHVIATSYSSRASAEAMRSLLGPKDADIKTFHTIEDARDWLRNG